MRALLLVLMVTTGCAGRMRPLSERVAEMDFGMAPRLPSPEAATYAALEQPPRDPLVAEILHGKHSDAGLEAAAAGLALAISDRKGGMSRWELREALWRAGYPYPVHDGRAWSVATNAAPPRGLVGWVEAVPADEPMGLVRARGRHEDTWVGLRARPEVDLGALPRLASVGTLLELPPLDGGSWVLTDGAGDLLKGDLLDGERLVLSSSGEWLLQVKQGGAEFARFPIYVGIPGPEGPILRLPDPPPPVATREDAEALLRDLLTHVRREYGLDPWAPNPVLDTAANRYVATPGASSGEILEGLGFPSATREVWACDEPTVEDCVDRWIWDPRRRKAVLSDDMDAYGLKLTLDTSGVHATLLLVGQPESRVEVQTP